jgi:DNA-binding LacI/PurR family transcriptional regulator
MPNEAPKSKRVTIKDVARHLQLSPSTVSRALAGDTSIRQQTREDILRAADELGYRRNGLAASLKMGRTNMVGVIVDSLLSDLNLPILEGAERRLHARGINMLVGNSAQSVEKERATLHMMEGALVDGVIVMPLAGDENLKEFLRFKRGGMPVVFLRNEVRGIIASSVMPKTLDVPSDQRNMAEAGVDLLLEMIENPLAQPRRVTL